MTKSKLAFAPLRPMQIAGYASGNMGKNIVANTLSLFLIYYMTDVLLISPALAGSIILLSLCCDAVLDPVIGVLADRYQSRWGKYGAFILLGAPLTSLAFVGIFTLPAHSATPVATLVACLLLFRLFYTAIDLPHNALISRISNDSRERATLATVRFFFSSLGSLCITLGSFYVFEQPQHQQQNIFATLAIVAASVSVCVMWLSWWVVGDRDRAAANHKTPFKQQFGAMKMLFTEKHAVLLIASGFVSVLSIPIFSKSMSYFGKYALQDESAISMGLTLIVVGQALSTPVWAFLARKINKSETLAIAHAINVVGVGLFWLLVTQVNWQFVACCALVGVGAGGIWSVIWAMVPDIVDKRHAETGIRSEAVFTSFVVVAMKAAQGIGTALFGVMLVSIGYQANQVQNSDTLDALSILMCAAPVVGSIACILLLSMYRFGHSHHERVCEQI